MFHIILKRVDLCNRKIVFGKNRVKDLLREIKSTENDPEIGQRWVTRIALSLFESCDNMRRFFASRWVALGQISCPFGLCAFRQKSTLKSVSLTFIIVWYNALMAHSSHTYMYIYELGAPPHCSFSCLLKRIGVWVLGFFFILGKRTKSHIVSVEGPCVCVFQVVPTCERPLEHGDCKTPKRWPF